MRYLKYSNKIRLVAGIVEVPRFDYFGIRIANFGHFGHWGLCWIRSPIA